ncbi:hypothetical protein [Demequina phytophila]|uniref:hypothetical protein n=1 Tax=Demequina phytophila TaxID=1638981 RepID=UPI000781DBE9|nr:hypothetical protein [Demequina phytophila]
MTSVLEEAMARRATAGLALYAPGSLEAAAHSRVRRARTMRGLGIAGVAAAVVVAGAWGAVALDGHRGAVAPAVTSPTPSPSASSGADATPGVLTAEDLTGAGGTVPDADSLPAYLCTSTLPRSCEELFVPARGLFSMAPGSTRVEVSALESSAEVTWELTYTGDEPARVATGWILPVARATDDYVGPADTLEGLSIQLPQDLRDVGAGTTVASSTVVSLGSAPSFAVGTAVIVDLLVPVAFADPDATRELWILVDGGNHPVTASDGDAAAGTVTADELRTEAFTRHREDYDLGTHAQTALDCRLDASLNPRTSTSVEDVSAPACDAVVLTTEAPLIAVTEMRFDVDDVAHTLTVRWTAQNVSGQRLNLDTGAAAVALETEYESTEPGASEFLGAGRAGTLLAQTLWETETTRHGLLRRATSVETLEPWQLFAGTGTFDVREVPDFAAALATVQVRVAGADDFAGDRELILEASWNN